MTPSDLDALWAACYSVEGLFFKAPLETLQGLHDTFIAGQIHDVLYFLNMVDSRNIPFIDCVLEGLNGWT